MFHIKNISIMIYIAITVALMGCAGPTSPFGAINSDTEATLEEVTQQTKTQLTGPSINFSPSRQVLHKQSDLEIKINSQNRIQDHPLLKIYYNNRNVTKAYLKQAGRNVSLDQNQINLQFKNLRLPAERFHQISVVFQSSPESPLVLAAFLPPTCTKNEEREIRSTASFSPPQNFLDEIRLTAKKAGYNPNFLAGLIAQESGFNEKSVSWGKAVGLTQMTFTADQEIEKAHPEWPRSSKIQNISAAQLKALVASGKINSKTDWRLDPQQSIEGGMLYLQYLAKYWQRPENTIIIKNNYSDYELGLTTVVIASYNSGAWRVKRALLEDGKSWLLNDELIETRKYVNSVMSYCYHFSKKET